MVPTTALSQSLPEGSPPVARVLDESLLKQQRGWIRDFPISCRQVPQATPSTSPSSTSSPEENTPPGKQDDANGAPCEVTPTPSSSRGADHQPGLIPATAAALTVEGSALGTLTALETSPSASSSPPPPCPLLSQASESGPLSPMASAASISTTTPTSTQHSSTSTENSSEQLAEKTFKFECRTVVLPTIDALVAQIGQAKLSTLLEEGRRRWSKLSPTEQQSLEFWKGEYAKEATRDQNPRFWIQELVNTIGTGEDQERQWITRQDTPLPKTDITQVLRKPDGLVVLRTVLDNGDVGWTNILVMLECSVTPTRALAPNKSIPTKTGQLLNRLTDMLANQPTRHFGWGITFSGPPDATSLDLIALDHEVVRVARLENCWSHANIGTVASLLRMLIIAPLPLLGLSPLFIYSPSLQPTFINLQDLESTFHVELNECNESIPGADDRATQQLQNFLKAPLQLVHPPLASLACEPFSRGTSVYRILSPEKDVVVKLSWSADDRAWREALAYRRANQKKTRHLPTLIFAFSAARLHSQVNPSQLHLLDPDRITLRHLCIIITTLPSPCRCLIDVAPTLDTRTFLACFPQIVEGLQDLEAAFVRHRDVSSNNILVSADGEIFIIDLDCAALTRPASSSRPSLSTPLNGRTGTLDTAAIEVLAAGDKPNFECKARHDVESTFYVYWKLLLRCHPSLSALENGRMYFGIRTNPVLVIAARQGLWDNNALPAGREILLKMAIDGMDAERCALVELRKLRPLARPLDRGDDDDQVPDPLEDARRFTQLLDGFFAAFAAGIALL